MPDWEKIGGFITGAGFAAFVAVFFMLKHDRKLTELSEDIRELIAVFRLVYRLDFPARRVGMGGGEERRKE